MTQDEIIEMARQAEFDLTPTPNMLYTVRGNYAQLNCLINLVAAKEREAWKNAAIRLGEELSSVGPDGYYNMTAEQWLDWAMNQQPRGKNSLSPPQRTEQEPKNFDLINESFEREEANQARVREFMRNH